MILKSRAASILATSLFCVASPAFAADYVIDKKGQHAFVNFKASHLGYSYIIGRFNDFSGTFSYDKADPASSKVSVSINTKSLDTNHAERDKHLRSADFFDVTKNPTATFESTGYKASADGDQLMGDLSINGVTKPVSIEVKHIGEGKDPWGGYRSGFEGNVTVNATDYGLPKWVGDVQITLNIEGVKQ